MVHSQHYLLSTIFHSADSSRDVVFYFTHSGTLLKVLTHLAIYNDSAPLTHNSFHRMKNRKWRVGRIDAFGTNLVFAKYTCQDEDYLLTLHQEKPVVLPGCTSPLCPLATLERTYHKSLHECHFEEMCRYEGDKTGESLRDDNTDHDEL
ncbi:hypothetical protein M8J76_015802 [Diaphorina citri]|nr:hypothetical protein M8J76_009785 [Diaphorina citri]KAI5722929.1 hypothetical protein M8J76_015802 [Diaphorina citri]